MPKTKTRTSDDVLRELRAFGLALPGAHTKSPWPGHLDLAVNDKTFAYLSLEDEPLSISCKLPHSCATALLLPFAEPTAYGLGGSGWVTAKFAQGEVPPLDLLQAWVDESYRAQAPKKLASKLTAAPANPSAPAKLARKATKPTQAAKPTKSATPTKPTKPAKKKAAPARKQAAKKRAAKRVRS